MSSTQPVSLNFYDNTNATETTVESSHPSNQIAPTNTPNEDLLRRYNDLSSASSSSQYRQNEPISNTSIPNISSSYELPQSTAVQQPADVVTGMMQQIMIQMKSAITDAVNSKFNEVTQQSQQPRSRSIKNTTNKSMDQIKRLNKKSIFNNVVESDTVESVKNDIKNTRRAPSNKSSSIKSTSKKSDSGHDSKPWVNLKSYAFSAYIGYKYMMGIYNCYDYLHAPLSAMKDESRITAFNLYNSFNESNFSHVNRIIGIQLVDNIEANKPAKVVKLTEMALDLVRQVLTILKNLIIAKNSVTNNEAELIQFIETLMTDRGIGTKFRTGISKSILENNGIDTLKDNYLARVKNLKSDSFGSNISMSLLNYILRTYIATALNEFIIYNKLTNTKLAFQFIGCSDVDKSKSIDSIDYKLFWDKSFTYHVIISCDVSKAQLFATIITADDCNYFKEKAKL